MAAASGNDVAEADPATADPAEAEPDALRQTSPTSPASAQSASVRAIHSVTERSKGLVQLGRNAGHQCQEVTFKRIHLFSGKQQSGQWKHEEHQQRHRGVKSWCRLLAGLDHTHDLALHLRVHLFQDVIIILLGIAFGLVLYNIVYATGWNKKDQKETIYMVCYPGVLFIRLITMISLPLMFTSITTGVASVMGVYHKSGKLFLNFAMYVVGTVSFAIILGLTFGDLMKPGHEEPSDYLKKKVYADGAGAYSAGQEIIDEAQTKELSALKHVMNTLDTLVPSNILVAITTNNLMGLCYFSVLFGLAASTLEDDMILRLLEQLNQCFVRMLPYRSQPYAVFFLVAKVVATNAADLGNILKALGVFVVAVVSGLAIMAFIVLPAIYFFVTRRPPFKYIKEMQAPLLVAFCTSSSLAALPYTMHAVGLNWPKTATARFVLPTGSQLNMCGTALFQAVVVAYIGQVNNQPLSFMQSMFTLFLLLISSMTTAGIPGTSLVTIVYVLRAVAPTGSEDVWVSSIALVLPVDKVLDMMRTVVNVLSDTICCAVVDTFQEGVSDTTEQVSGFEKEDLKHHTHVEHHHHGEHGNHSEHSNPEHSPDLPHPS